MTAAEIRRELDRIVLRQEAWEDDEDIMTFNGSPIGATIGRRGRTIQIGRWWPSLKDEIAQWLADAQGAEGR
jgi:hypothetical protein